MAKLVKGAKGKEVNVLQTALNKNGASPKLKVDGVFGPITDKAVRDFQKKSKLKVDGYGGPITGFALGIAKRPSALDWPLDGDVKDSFDKYMFERNQRSVDEMTKMIDAAIKETATLVSFLERRKTELAGKKSDLQSIYKSFMMPILAELIKLKAASDKSSSPSEIMAIHALAKTAEKKKKKGEEAAERKSIIKESKANSTNLFTYLHGVKALKKDFK